ncbi:MAG: hemolysin III family protein [Defluviitaleaceae bacterium]|nr:hemolysin III family protein [Defluviitaleaceae bacterium]
MNDAVTVKRKSKLELPNYTRGEERFNMITHIVGGGLGLVALLACVIVAAFHQNVMGIVSGAIYGFSVILLFTMSSIYHGLNIGFPKKIFRVLDHCTIYILIAGTYTPILLTRFREVYPLDAWLMFGVLWGFAIVGVTLTAIDRKRFMPFALVCYLGMGWMAMFRISRLVEVLGLPFFILILIGGVLYTLGVIFYAVGKKRKYMHSIFHLFVNGASILHSVAIATFVMPRVV